MVRTSEPETRHTGHLSAETLAAYREDRLPDRQMEEIREHLVGCEECSAWMVELTDFDPADESGSDPSELEMAAAWRRQKTRLAAAGKLGGAGRPDGASRGWLPGGGWAAAAVLGILCFGVTWWNVVLQQRLGLVTEPRINPPLVSLEPRGAVREIEDARSTLKLSQAEHGWLILNHSHLGEYDDLQIELRTLDGRPVWTRAGLAVSEAGNLRLEIESEWLAPGTYEIALSGRHQDRSRLLAEYLLRVE